MIDMYARNSVDRIAGPLDAAGIDRIRASAAAAPDSLFLVQLPTPSRLRLPWRASPPEGDASLPWMQAAGLRPAESYSLPYGRRYALLQVIP
jgi:hypothetical protein